MRPSSILLPALLSVGAVAAGCGSHFDVEVKRDDASAVLVRLLPCEGQVPNRNCQLNSAEDVFSLGSGTGGSRKIEFQLQPGTSVVSFNGLVCGPGLTGSCTRWDIPVTSDGIDLTFQAYDDGTNATGLLYSGDSPFAIEVCSGFLGMPPNQTDTFPPGC